VSGLFYWSSFRLNQTLDDEFAFAAGISLVFLPAGVKLLAILMGRWPALLGILTASVYLSPGFWPGKSLTTVFYFAAMGVITYPIAIYAVMHAFRIRHDLSNLRYGHIVTLAVIVSVFNGVLHNFLFYSQGVTAAEDLWLKSAAMSLGDFMGCFIVVTLFQFVSRWLRRHLLPNSVKP
jgi:hypothetical protein